MPRMQNWEHKIICKTIYQLNKSELQKVHRKTLGR